MAEHKKSHKNRTENGSVSTGMCTLEVLKGDER